MSNSNFPPDSNPEVEARFQRIQKQLDWLAENEAQSRTRIDKLEKQIEKLIELQQHTEINMSRLEANISRLTDALISLTRLFERHIGDGHTHND